MAVRVRSTPLGGPSMPPPGHPSTHPSTTPLLPPSATLLAPPAKTPLSDHVPGVVKPPVSGGLCLGPLHIHTPIQGGWGTPSQGGSQPPWGVERGVERGKGVTSFCVPGFSFWSSPSETTFIGIDRHPSPKEGVGVIYDCTRFCKNLTRAKTWKQAAHTPARTPCSTPTLTPTHPPAHPPW